VSKNKMKLTNMRMKTLILSNVVLMRSTRPNDLKRDGSQSNKNEDLHFEVGERRKWTNEFNWSN
jgi:hypothetical protein